jgi:hypothetical protein
MRPHYALWLKYSELFAAILQIVATKNFSALPSYEDFLKNPNSFLPSLKDIEGNFNISINQVNSSAVLLASTLLTRLRTQASYFAFTDYLIRKNLSAVVDMPALPIYMDAHGALMFSYLDELVYHHATFASFFALQRSLARIQLPEGGTLLDATLISLHTDFDRRPFHEPLPLNQTQPLAIGTDHGSTASLLLAGYGIQGERVVGGVHDGPGGTHSRAFPDLEKTPYLSPLPINPSDGKVSSSGRVPNILSVAPTLLSAFDAVLPAQQVTEFGVVPAVIKKESG